MKKVLVVLSLFIFMGFVNAESCEVISGSGKSIGDEVKCGTESFYVIKHEENKTKLFAKYNLYVGHNISYIEAGANAPIKEGYNWVHDIVDYCENLAIEKGYNPDFVAPMGTDPTGIDLGDPGSIPNGTNINGCRVYEMIEDNHVVQNKKALGTFLVNGKSKLPLYGITFMSPMVASPGNYDDNGDLIVSDSEFGDYFIAYQLELATQGIGVENVSFITLRSLKELLVNIYGKEIEFNLREYDANSGILNEIDNPFVSKMDIKEYIPEKYKWIYDSTYWVGSGYNDDGQYPVGNDYYVSNEGMLCALGRGVCYYFHYPIGNGVRPVVTISNKNIAYNYKFIEGMGQMFNLNRNSNMKFRLNMEYEDFVDNGKIFIDDEEYDCNCYVLSKGSTIVTLKDSCAKKISLGKHTIKATLNNGEYEAVTNFIVSSDVDVISKVKQIVENPNTSDKSVIIVIVAFISLLILFGTLRNKLFTRKYENI